MEPTLYTRMKPSPELEKKKLLDSCELRSGRSGLLDILVAHHTIILRRKESFRKEIWRFKI